jgi:hypothetical protein
MIVCIKDLLHGADISESVERDSQFSIEATFGARMDVLNMVVHDPERALALPNRREIVIYDAPSETDIERGAPGTADVVDPPWAISAYNIFRHGSKAAAHVSTNPALWTPRLFAGYLATPEYKMLSTERQITVSAQDFTYRLRSTVCNQAFPALLTDDAIVKAIFKQYRPDFNTVNVLHTFSGMPAISFPVHSLEQFMQRITKITRAVYRVDYFKRLWYGPIGQFPAPFTLAESPDPVEGPASVPPRIGYEAATYTPDSASLSDRVWVVGRDFQSATQTYIIPAALTDGSHFQFTLPGSATKFDIVSVQVDHGAGYVSKTFGEAPQDGDITDQSTFKTQVVFQPTPPTVAFKVTPSVSDLIKIVGKFRYPLITIYSDAGLVASVGGLFFDAVVRDKRIRDLKLAQHVGKAYLVNQGNTLKGMSVTVMTRAVGNINIGPAQTIVIDAPLLFTGLFDYDSLGHIIPGSDNPKTFIVTRTTLTLDQDSDLQHPYRVELELADHASTGGQ